MTDRLRGPGPVLGLWSVTADPKLLEASAALKPDFLVIDTQHGAAMARLTTETFGAIAFYDVPALVRVPSIDPADIGRALDLGAAGIIAPLVNDAADARLAALACRYAPDGIRSYGMQTLRIDPFSDDYRPLCVVQIETAAGVDNVDEIAAVDGVDWLYVGPADLGLSIGGVPAPDVISIFDGSHPLAEPLQTAFRAVLDAAARHGKLAGLHCNGGEAALALVAQGFEVTAVATDLGAARKGMDHELRIARDVSANP
jgi:4-hydroxy-2-oxoheptanedioate aldolase